MANTTNFFASRSWYQQSRRLHSKLVSCHNYRIMATFDKLLSIMPSDKETKYYGLMDELLRSGNTVRVAVRGISMFPLLMKGDVVLVKQTAIGHLKKGAVVVFEGRDAWVAHRLLRVTNKGLLTRGDANRNIDELVPYSHYKGMVVKIGRARWPLARLALGLPGKCLAYTGKVTGPLFWLIARIASKIYLFFKASAK